MLFTISITFFPRHQPLLPWSPDGDDAELEKLLCCVLYTILAHLVASMYIHFIAIPFRLAWQNCAFASAVVSKVQL